MVPNISRASLARSRVKAAISFYAYSILIAISGGVKGKAHQGYSRVGQDALAWTPARPFSGLDSGLQEIADMVNKFKGR